MDSADDMFILISPVFSFMNKCEQELIVYFVLILSITAGDILVKLLWCKATSLVPVLPSIQSESG